MSTLRRDFLAFTAGAVVARTVLPVAAKAAAAEHPDTALLALCRRHAVELAAINATEADCEDVREWPSYLRTIGEIGRARPTTLEGAAAKARAARLESLTPDGKECPAGTVAETWAWQLMGDLTRLSGGAA